MTINTTDARHLTEEEARRGTAEYERLVAEYEAKKQAEGGPRSPAEFYIYEGFWIRAYGAKYVVFPKDATAQGTLNVA